MTTQTILIIGCGDIGLRVAWRLRDAGLAVRGQVRTQATADALAAEGIAPLIADLDAPAEPGEYGLVYWFAPPPPTGEGDPRLRGWLAANTARKLVYISTTGVYGDCHNRWIDESEPPNPKTPRGRRRVDAENALAAHAAAHPDFHHVVLRVPGIYGPGRMPVERLKAGFAVVRPEESPTTNRIHAEDLATAAIAAAERGRRGAAYNVSDGSPTTMADYFSRCARLLGLPEPPRVSMDEARRTFTPAMLSFLEESKRLVTRRMREELGVTPRYPDLASGLPACLGEP